MIHVALNRLSSDLNQTLGILHVYNASQCLFTCKALELPNLRNEPYISRIVAGRYLCKKRHSQKYGWHYHITGVPGRTLILIHPGNYNRDTKGCILLGAEFIDINADGQLDVTSSRKTVAAFEALMPEEFFITITDLDY